MIRMEIIGDIGAMMAAELVAGEKAVTKAVGDAGISLKTAWRGQITGAGLGQRLARTIRAAQYPKGKPSLNRLLKKDFEERFSSTSSMPGPTTFLQLDERARKTTPFLHKRSGDGLFQQPVNAAALVWSQAPVVVGAHDTGPLIRSRNGFWLAIPTAAAGKSARGGRITPGEWERRRGLRLRFIYRPRGPSLLVAQVKLRKSLDLARDAKAAQAQIPGAIVAHWVAQR